MYLTINWKYLNYLNLSSCLLNTSHISLLSDGIAINNSIEILNLSNNNAGEEGGQALGKALRLNQSILKLNVSNNHLNDLGCRAICEAMSPYKLSKLSNASNKSKKRNGDCRIDPLTVIEIETLEEHSSRNNTIQYLDISSNNIGCIGGVYFGDVLRTTPSLIALNLCKNRIGDKTLQVMADGKVYIFCSDFFCQKFFSLFH